MKMDDGSTFTDANFSSPESRALRHHFSYLLKAIREPLDLSAKLFAKYLIDHETMEKANVMPQTIMARSLILLIEVTHRVQAHPGLFHDFVDVLKKEELLWKVAETLEVTYSHFSKEPPEQYTHSITQPYPPSPTDHPTLNQPLTRSPLHNYCCYLRAYFGKFSLPTETKWQPSVTKSYINLAVIRREEVTHQELLQFTTSTLHGDVDEILKVKEPVKIEHILDSKPDETLQCILIEGAPGVGKTTLAWHLCHQWGKGDLLQQYVLIILVKLRDRTVSSTTSLANLLISQTDDSETEEIAEHLKNTYGENVLVILEGLDEIPTYFLTQPSDSILTKLLSGTLLPHATILVTSRPSATVHLWDSWKNRISRHIEVLGFTKDNIAEYIQTNLNDDECKEFRRYLSISTHIRSLMYIPINCTIVIAIYKDCLYHSKSLPRTVTELYTCLVRSILRRYLKSHNYDENFNEFTSLPSPVYTDFYNLTWRAYLGVQYQSYIFGGEINHLGLMDVVAEQNPFECSHRFSNTFLHLSIQEYLAAYFISIETVHMQEQILEEKCNVKQFRNVCRFLAGITKFKGIQRSTLTKVMNEFCKTLNEQTGPRQQQLCGIVHELLETIERLMEQRSRDGEEEELWAIAADLLQSAERLLEQKNSWVIQIKDRWRIAIQLLNTIDRLLTKTWIEENRYSVTRDLLGASERLGRQLSQEMQEIGEEGMLMLVRLEELKLMEKVMMSGNRQFASVCMMRMQNVMNRVDKLSIQEKLSYEKLLAEKNNIKLLTTDVINISTYALRLLHDCDTIEVLQCHQTYNYMLTDFNSLIDFSALGYCIACSNCKWRLQLGTSLQYMQLTQGIELLIQEIQRYSDSDRQSGYKINSLNFYHNNQDCIQRLLTAFPCYIHQYLERLQFHSKTIQPLPECVPMIISKTKMLQVLVLEGATTDSLICILEVLANSPNATLTELQLSRSKFSLPIMKTLCSALLCHTTSLVSLKLHGCCINDNQTSHLREVLSNLSHLTTLCLSSNDIHDREAAAIADATHTLKLVELQGNPISAMGCGQLGNYSNIHYQ